jgi:hypothetical protein
MLAAGRSAIHIAHVLGVSVQSIYRWRAEAAARDAMNSAASASTA